MRSLVVVALLGIASLLVPACKPEQPAESTSCAALSDCPQFSACDPATKLCTTDLTDRFVGTFACRPALPSDDANLLDSYAQVAGSVKGASFTLTRAVCVLLDHDSDASTPALLGVDLAPSGSTKQSLSILIRPETLSTGNVTLGRHIELGLDAAAFEDKNVKRRYGTSDTGTFKVISGAPSRGELVTVSLDVRMLRTTSEDPRYGKPCTKGLVECGSLFEEVGGVGYCSTVLKSDTEPVCVRSCLSNADCGSVGVVCVGGYCAQPCILDGECEAPTVCIQLVPGGPKGCL